MERGGEGTVGLVGRALAAGSHPVCFVMGPAADVAWGGCAPLQTKPRRLQAAEPVGHTPPPTHTPARCPSPSGRRGPRPLAGRRPRPAHRLLTGSVAGGRKQRVGGCQASMHACGPRASAPPRSHLPMICAADHAAARRRPPRAPRACVPLDGQRVRRGRHAGVISVCLRRHAGRVQPGVPAGRRGRCRHWLFVSGSWLGGRRSPWGGAGASTRRGRCRQRRG